MLVSMTGFGEARTENDRLAISAEVRTINSRHFKLNIRAGEGYSSLEPRIDALVRQHVRRGTVQVSLRVTRHASADDFRLNSDVLAYFRERLVALQKNFGEDRSIALEQLLTLPGVVERDNVPRILFINRCVGDCTLNPGGKD